VTLPLEEVRRVVLGDGAIYPQDNAEQKRKFFELLEKLDLITLLVDPTGRLEGFLISYRTQGGADLDPQRPVQLGDTISVDVAWIRPDLRGDGRALRRLIAATFFKNRLVWAGAERIVFNRQKDGGRPRWHDYVRFSQGYL